MHARVARNPAHPIIRAVVVGAIKGMFESGSAYLPQNARVRLFAVMPGLLAKLEANDHEVIRDLAELMTHPANIIALYVVTHLDQIDARFAA